MFIMIDNKDKFNCLKDFLTILHNLTIKNFNIKYYKQLALNKINDCNLIVQYRKIVALKLKIVYIYS